MAHAFFLGVDSRSSDGEDAHEATHALIEKSTDSGDEDAAYRLDHIRHRSGIPSADAFADHLQGVIADQPYIGRTSLIVNRTDAFGQALVGALRDRGMDPVAATLTDSTGTAAGETDEMGVHLGGINLVRTLAELHRNEQITLAGHTSETASRLARDVQALAEQLDEADGDIDALDANAAGPSFDPEATHLTSAGLAAWLGTERSFDPSKHLKGAPRPESSRANGA